MKREIKFRAWDKNKSRWLDLRDQHMNPLTGMIMIDEDNSCGDPECCGGPQPYWCDNSNYILMQFTGLKDKNGKEIYEGDVLIIHSDLEWIKGYKFYCEWDIKLTTYYLNRTDMINNIFKGSCGHSINYYETIGDGFHDKIYEVIGNIYENENLINGEQK